jgi:hypothetical protein
MKYKRKESKKIGREKNRLREGMNKESDEERKKGKSTGRRQRDAKQTQLKPIN